MDEIYICTSIDEVDDILEDIANIHNIKIYRGSPINVIERMVEVGKITKADTLIRITGDNPLTTIEFIKDQIKFLESEKLDYVRLVDVPIGATPEVIARKALNRCYEIIDHSLSEYLLLFLFNPKIFSCGVIKIHEKDFSDLSITVDTKEDYNRLRFIISQFPEFKDRPENLLLENIIGINNKIKALEPIEDKNFPNIKYPYGKVISYNEFMEDMRDRINKSKKLILK
jgi:spore coat polysaccharide biosynthesis protein SpsF